MLAGLVGIGLMLPPLSLISSFSSAMIVWAAFTVPIVMMVTPSLAYMAEATSAAGVRSFGVAYGVYNVAGHSGCWPDLPSAARCTSGQASRR